MIEIDLKTDVPVECHAVYLAISKTDRQYVLPVLMHVQDMNGKATPESLSAELFPGLEPLSRKLLETCRGEGLVQIALDHDNTEYRITEEGKYATDSKRVFVREAGRMWKIHYANHAIIPREHRVLGMDADPREAGYDPKMKGEQTVTAVPGHIRDMQGEELKVPKINQIRIDEIGRDAKSIKPDIGAVIHWRVTAEKSPVSLKIIGCDSEIVFASDLEFKYVAEKLVGSDPRWNEKLECFDVEFGETDPDERRTMQRILKFDNPVIDEYKFDSAMVRMPLRPKNNDEAQKWGRWIMGDRAGERVNSAEYQKWAKEIDSMFVGYDIHFADKISEYFENVAYSSHESDESKDDENIYDM